MQDRNSQHREAGKSLNMSQEKMIKKANAGGSTGRNVEALPDTRSQLDEYDRDDEFGFDLQDDQDEYDLDLDDETMAALAAPSLNTKRALTFAKKPETEVGNAIMSEAQGSTSPDPAKLAKAVALIPKTMLPPTLVVAFKKEHLDTPRHPAPDPPATQGNSFSFDGVDEEDLLNIVVDGSQTLKSARTIPWNNRPEVTPSLGTAEARTPDYKQADD